MIKSGSSAQITEKKYTFISSINNKQQKMKKLLFKLTFTLLGVICFSSCMSNFYQVYSVETNGAKQIDNSLVFENEDCKVLYNLWSNNGKVNFAFYNKTDKDIFINLGQTFFIKNGLATDYYQDRTYSKQQSALTSNSYITSTVSATIFDLWGDNVYMEKASVIGTSKGNKSVKTNSYAITTKEKEIVCVPANCYKTFAYYEANPSQVVTCNKEKDYPKDIADIAEYNKSNSPLTITNRIAYGFQKDDVAEKHMDNTFWITSIKNYSQNAATEYLVVTDECEKKKVGSDKKGYSSFSVKEKVRQFKIGGPNKFYIFYTN